MLGSRGPIGKEAGPACDATETVQTSMSKGTVLVLDRSCKVLSKTWNIYEIFNAIRQQQSTFCIAIPQELSHNEIFHMFKSFSTIDIAKSTPDGRIAAERPEVISRMRQRWGLTRAAKDLPDGLKKALFVRLRWKGESAEDIANSACLLYQQDELLQLQLFLSNADMGKIVDGNVMKNIFTMYDTDSSGTIDVDELIAGLTNAGYSETECIDIFHEIDTDNSMLITFAEFDDWFEKQKKGQGDSAGVVEQMCQQKKSDTSFNGLVTELEVVIAFSSRNKLEDQSLYLRNAKSVIEGKMRKMQAKAPRDQTSWLKLPATALKDFCLSEVATKVAAKEFKAASQCLYIHLTRLPVLLDFDPESLQQPFAETLGATSKDHSNLCVVYLAALARILQFKEQHHPLELEFCVYSLADQIEAWGMGVCKAFFKRSRSLLDGKPLSNHPLVTSGEKLELAQALIKIRGEDSVTSVSLGSELSLGTRYSQLSVSKILLTEPVSSVSDLRARVMKKFEGDDRGIAIPLKRSLSRSLSRSRSRRSSHGLPGLSEGSFRAQSSASGLMGFSSLRGGSMRLGSKSGAAAGGFNSHLMERIGHSAAFDPYEDEEEDQEGTSLLDMDGSRSFKMMTEVMKEDQHHRLSTARVSGQGLKSFSGRPLSSFGGSLRLNENSMSGLGPQGGGGARRLLPLQSAVEVDLSDLLEKKLKQKSPIKAADALIEEATALILPSSSPTEVLSPSEQKRSSAAGDKMTQRGSQGGVAHKDLVSRVAAQLAGKVMGGKK